MTMRTCIAMLLLTGLAACGGTPPAEPPKTETPKVEAPKVETPPPAAKKDLAAMSDDEKKAYMLEIGKNVYETGGSGGVACITCHQADGKGLTGAFPPLAGQKDIMGDCVKHAGLVVHGYSGEITVDGAKFNGQMPAQPTLSDEEIAGAISFERSSFGNDFGICLPDAVATARTAPPPKL
jgi:mono/diheme cytochrome c family protein